MLRHLVHMGLVKDSVASSSPNCRLSDEAVRGSDALNELWVEALAKHQSQLGHSLFSSEWAREIQEARNLQEVGAVVDRQAGSFERYRRCGGKVKDSLKEFVNLAISLSDSVGEGVAVSIISPYSAFKGFSRLSRSYQAQRRL